jgi:hypothetical protein
MPRPRVSGSMTRSLGASLEEGFMVSAGGVMPRGEPSALLGPADASSAFDSSRTRHRRRERSLVRESGFERGFGP